MCDVDFQVQNAKCQQNGLIKAVALIISYVGLESTFFHAKHLSGIDFCHCFRLSAKLTFKLPLALDAEVWQFRIFKSLLCFEDRLIPSAEISGGKRKNLVAKHQKIGSRSKIFWILKLVDTFEVWLKISQK